jgi:hypothetical protein
MVFKVSAILHGSLPTFKLKILQLGSTCYLFLVYQITMQMSFSEAVNNFTKDHFRCARCLENGHRARECRNPWRPLSSLACLAAPPVTCLGTAHRQVSASCEGSMGSTVPPKADCCRS